MNSPTRVIGFVNAAHFIDHYAMLIFAAAVIIMGPALGMSYSELLPYATPGFVAFGAGSLITGWLGDRWSRRHMMVIFFAGIGAAMISVGLVRTPLQLGAALLAIGLFASIYHPVGTAMIVSYADKLGREMGLNGVWGNLGVASSALVTGVIGQYLGWRFAFIVPGIVTILIGVAFALSVVHEDRKGTKQAAAQARVAREDMWRVIVALLIVLIIGLAGTLASVGTIVWVIPASDQAFQVTIAERVGRPVAFRPAETPPRSLHDEALALKSEGREDKAGRLLFSYHARWAILGAALVFALFGLGVTTLRLRGAATAAIAIIACAVYVSYFFEMAQVRPTGFSDERISFALAWLPNLLMTVTSVAFLSVREPRHLPSDT